MEDAEAKGIATRTMSFIYYTGRGLQLIGMWLLLVDLFMAGPLGPDARLFAAGVGVFILGWWLSRLRRPSS